MSIESAARRGRSPNGIEISRSGAEVLILGNLATASLVNPEREAAQWAEAQMKRIASIRAHEPVIIVGIGSGFHLRALQTEMTKLKMTNPIIAIDTCADSVQFASERLSNVTLILADTAVSIDLFLARADIASWIVQTFTLLKHKPTIARVGSSLRELESWLVGRTPQAFSAHLKARPQIAAALNPARARRIAETQLVSIRDLSKIWDISSELKVDRRIFRVLEELVK